MERISKNYEEKIYRNESLKIFFTMIILYTFYFTANNNLGPAIKPLQDELQISSSKAGTLLTVFTFVFAVGQFASGFIADKFGAKNTMLAGAIGGAISNICFGMSGSLFYLCLFWGVNALFLSMGWSSGCKILYSWIRKDKWGLYMGIYNAFSFMGGVIAYPVTAFAIMNWGWRAAFFIPPVFLIFWSMVFHLNVKDKPGSIEYKNEDSIADRNKVSLKDYFFVIKNKLIVLICFSAICSQFVRWGLLNWGIKILVEPVDKGGFGLSLVTATAMASFMHWGGAMFSVLLGYVSDNVFNGKRWQVIVIGFVFSCMGLLGLYCLMKSQYAHKALIATVFFISGGCIQGLQAPIFNLPEAVLGSRLRGIATGIINGWSYIGASFSGIFLGMIFDIHGYGTGIALLAAISLIGGICIGFVKR